MLITATQKYTRQSPRKVRLVANAVKKLSLPKALKQLSVMEKRASLVVMKTTRQAMANAINNHHFSADQLLIEDIKITEGPRYKRFQPVSRGRAHSILKRTSHIQVILKTEEEKAPIVADKAPAPKSAEVVKQTGVVAEPQKAETTKGVKAKTARIAQKAVATNQAKNAVKKTIKRTTHK